jgi:hypothetical protein
MEFFRGVREAPAFNQRNKFAQGFNLQSCVSSPQMKDFTTLDEFGGFWYGITGNTKVAGSLYGSDFDGQT